jgi:hypothetical protein
MVEYKCDFGAWILSMEYILTMFYMIQAWNSTRIVGRQHSSPRSVTRKEAKV